MNRDIDDRVSLARSALEREEDAPTIGRMPTGHSGSIPEEYCPRSYAEFLGVCDGCRAGAIDLWSFSGLSSHQYVVKTFAGGPARWCSVGQLAYDPICIERKSGLLYLLATANPSDETVRLGDCDHFVTHYLFGKGYLEFLAQDKWTSLLLKLGFLA